MKRKNLSQLSSIPGVGKAIAQDLNSLGIYSVLDLKDKNPERLYEELCQKQGIVIDRCMLYVMRCAVYFASNEIYEPELLKWWNWKDSDSSQRTTA